MTDTEETITAREVLDGEWVNCWEALEIADQSLRRHAIQTPLPAGQILARMAATGYLPTISNDVNHSAPLPPDHVPHDELTEQQCDERHQAAMEEEQRKAEGKGKWQLVPITLWGSVFGFSGFEDRLVHFSGPDFKNSSIIAVYTKERLAHGAPLWEVGNDPGFHLEMARNILVYRDGLYAVDRYAAGRPDEGDKYSYNDLDLSRLKLPDVLPLQDRLSRLARHLDSEQSSGTSRGRPGGRNGEPIAALTIMLMGLDDRTLASYTADAAGAELQGYYAALGSPARSIDNCRKDAAGVLRQVKGARSITR